MADMQRDNTPTGPAAPDSAKKDGDAGARSTSPSEDGELADNNPPLPEEDAPLPEEDAPPLPGSPPPEDDGWEALQDPATLAYYFYNKFTHVTQWENPRVPTAGVSYAPYDSSAGQVAPYTYPQAGAPGIYSYAQAGAPGTMSTAGAPGTMPPKRVAGGYNPAIHGSYDPNADYAKEASKQEEEEAAAAEAAAAAALAGILDPTAEYTATGKFNRFTGKFQNESINPDNHNDENKSKRQMSAFFDVDAAANSHDGRSLKAERRGKALTKKELKAFKDKRREKKEEKRRAWLRD